MNIREKTLIYYLQQLNWITEEKTKELASSDLLEAYLQQLSIPQSQALQLLYFKHFLIQYANQAGYLTLDQGKELLIARVEMVKKGDQKLFLMSIKSGILQPKFIKEVLNDLVHKKLLLKYELQSLCKQLFSNHNKDPLKLPNKPDFSEGFIAPSTETEILTPSTCSKSIKIDMCREISHDGFSCKPFPYRFGKYEIIEEIGQGGMGKVYRATDTELRREVALKKILILNK